MNGAPLNAGMSRPLFAALQLRDFDVSWAGPLPLRSGFCFGSEDGRLLFTDESGLQIGEPMKGSISGQAINGVAHSGEWLAVSTRAEVTMGSMRPETERKRGAVVFPHGAHGITAAPSGYFVAPLGRTGIMMLQAGASPSDTVGVLSSDKEGMYLYRVLALRGRNEKDLLVSACRQGGIGITEVRWGEETYNMRVATFNGLDVVDVCAVGSDSESPAVAALGHDGTLILIHDALHDEKPVTMKFNTVQGTAYRLLRRGEHLFVLTSRGLYGLMKLAGRLVMGMPPGGVNTRILSVPMQAVDANLVSDRWLLVITPDEVRKFDVDLIEQNKSEDLGNGEIREALPITLTPAWEMYGVSQTGKQLVTTP